mgnify:CR=1 FL=1
MRKLFLSLAMVFSAYAAFAQADVQLQEKDIRQYQDVEVKPTFQDGDANAFAMWVAQQIVYPETAKESGASGRVILQFTIAKDGSVTDVKVVRGVHPDLDKEVVRVVTSSPKWNPGKHKGQAVPVMFTFPVVFKM